MGTPRLVFARSSRHLNIQPIEPMGSMGPKVKAACNFVEQTGRDVAIGALADVAELIRGTAGTIVTREISGWSSDDHGECDRR